jgi:hypothetical protein
MILVFWHQLICWGLIDFGCPLCENPRKKPLLPAVTQKRQKPTYRPRWLFLNRNEMDFFQYHEKCVLSWLPYQLALRAV